MTDLITPTGRVHWLGTGLSTGSGLGLVAQGTELTLWGRTAEKAAACLDRLGLTGQAAVHALDLESLAAELMPGDVVVSMLPTTQHAAVAGVSLEHGTHFACSSYLNPEIAGFAEAAERAGLVFLTEAGLDPGIDHLLAHELVRKAAQMTGDRPATVRFTSYCGSNPAVPGEFRYQFNWAPRGVLTALLTPARYIDDRVEKIAPYPWESVRKTGLNGEQFEVYPNRDSLPFMVTYQFPPTWTAATFVRGTLRWAGWSDAWSPVFTELRHADDDRITNLARELAERYPTAPTDRDRVLMSVALEVRPGGGPVWNGEYLLDITGDASESATPRLVSTALAGGILEITGGGMEPGLHQATADQVVAKRWLAFLSEHGIAAQFRAPSEPM